MDAGIREIFKRNLKLARTSRKLTQKDVADRLKVEPRYYQKIEYGEVWPSPEYVKRLCKAIGCEERELFEGPQNGPTIDFKHIETAVLAAVKEAAVPSTPSLPSDIVTTISKFNETQMTRLRSLLGSIERDVAKPIKKRKSVR